MFISQSVEAVIQTMFEAVILVVIVVILFLQTWRASIVPIVAIPVSLIGTFAVLAGARLSRSTTCRCSAWCWPSASWSTTPSSWWRTSSATSARASVRATPRYKTMDEVGGALIAIALVLIAVFVPTAFLTGILGQFFRQFALTIAASTVISLLRLADLESRVLRAAVQAARVASVEGQEHFSMRADQCFLPRLQPRLRMAVSRAMAG